MIASLHRMRARKKAVALSAKVGQLTEVGKFSEAIPVAQQALASWETAAGPDDAEVATALFRLAEFYRELDRSADAEPLYVRSLAIREQVLGPDHPDVAELLYNLARLYKNQRREADAEQCFLRAQAIYEKSFGPDHMSIAMVLSGLTHLRKQQGRYADAESLYFRALAISEKEMGSDHDAVGALHQGLGDLFAMQRQFAEAERHYTRALAILQEALGQNHRTVLTRRALARLYRLQGRDAEAATVVREALPWFERTIAEAEKGDIHGRVDHESLGASLHEVGHCLSSSGQFADALPRFERAVAAKEKGDVHGRVDHESLGASLHEVGHCLLSSGRFAEARPWFERAVAEAEQGDVHGRVDHQSLEAMKAAIHDIEVAPSVAPLDDTSRQELAARTAKGLEILGLKAVADPATVADSVLRWIYYFKEPQKSAAADDQIAVAVAYGDAVARVTGWQWNLYLWQGHQDFALISPDARYVHLPISFISRQLAAASEATALLLFNMLAAGDFPQARPGDLAVLG